MELAKKHEELAKNYKTVYMWGAFGVPVTQDSINQKAKQYPSWYTSTKQSDLKKLINQKYFGFDCVNLTKAILWGWCGDSTKSYGGAVYCSNGVPDVNADTLITKCKEVKTTDWDKITVGEGLWMPGHWGLYIGNGLAVECTPSWKNGVQITAVGNIGSKSGYNTRTWKKHGKLPYITYVEDSSNGEHEENKKKVAKRFDLEAATINWLDTYKYKQALFEKLANKK